MPKNISLNLFCYRVIVFVFLLLQGMSNEITASQFCDPAFNARDFETAAMHRPEFLSVGHLMISGENLIIPGETSPSSALSYISFASAHYFGQDSKGNYYATTSAHVIDKFKVFQEQNPALILYLFFNDSFEGHPLIVVENSCHPNHSSLEDSPYQYDIALLKLQSKDHPQLIPTPLDLREHPVPDNDLPLYAVGFGPTGWVGGILCQYDNKKHGVYVYVSKDLTTLHSEDEPFQNSWLAPLSYRVDQESYHLRSLLPLEGGLNNGMSGGVCFYNQEAKTYAIAINTAIVEHSKIPIIPDGHELFSAEKSKTRIHARLTGEAVSGINPVKGQVDIVVPFYAMKSFLIRKMREWGVSEEEIQTFFIL